MRINFIDNNDGTTTGMWELKFTALNEQGNEIIDSMPDKDPRFAEAIAELEYFVINGELM